MSKYKTYFKGEIPLRVAQIVNTEQLQHYILQQRGLFWYIIVNTLHKGDNKGDNKDDDDDDNDNDDDNNNNNNNNKNKGDTSNNWSDWNHFQIIQKIRE